MNIEKNSKRKGDEYESFVQKLMSAISKAESTPLESGQSLGLKNIKVEKNIKIEGKSGIKRQFDLYWEHEIAGIVYKTVVECKNYNKKVPISVIDALLGNLIDFPNIKGVIATNEGFASGVIERAEKHGIELVVAREMKNEDWVNSDGVPLLKGVAINMRTQVPPSILSTAIEIDKRWLLDNIAFKENDRLGLGFLSNEIVFEDDETKEAFSIQKLTEDHVSRRKEKFGEFTVEKVFKNAFIRLDTGRKIKVTRSGNKEVSVMHTDEVFKGNKRIKILSCKVAYQMSEPIVKQIDVDGEDLFLGVVDYVLKKRKIKVIKNGT